MTAPAAMLRNRIYYRLKPFLPLALRLALRRSMARRTRRHASPTWPILPGSERAPPDWPGWPHGKKFAFVLTHDIESRTGHDRCRDLMRLEDDRGFRSSFNFIPEGDYDVDPALRRDLAAAGFEIGVHDLHHDGKLFSSRDAFARRATRINHHLLAWGARGFRAGFMLHELGWLHDLAIDYDASTFDTDPFEPQPDGVGTIFPFTVRSRPGEPAATPAYVELPYTLPQDSTLFRLLGEPGPDVWIQKLDWIAAHGGMALVNTHPDYMSFHPGPTPPHHYPAGHFSRLLDHVRHHYNESAWCPLPRDLARYIKSLA